MKSPRLPIMAIGDGGIMEKHNTGLFATTKSLIKFERTLFNCYRLAGKAYPQHEEVWNSLALAKLARIKIYQSVLTKMKKHPLLFRVKSEALGTFINLYFKLRRTEIRLKSLQISEDEFLKLLLYIEKHASESGLVPTIIFCEIGLEEITATLNKMQIRQARVLEGFLHQEAVLI